MGAITLVAKAMPKLFTVNLDNPDVAVLVNVNARIAGACILDGKLFTKYEKLNVEKFNAKLQKNETTSKPTNQLNLSTPTPEANSNPKMKVKPVANVKPAAEVAVEQAEAEDCAVDTKPAVEDDDEDKTKQNLNFSNEDE